MKAKITRYLIPLLILTIIITFCSFSCSPPGPAKQTIEETAQETINENSIKEPEEEPAEEVAAEEVEVEEVTGEPEEEEIEAIEESSEEKEDVASSTLTGTLKVHFIDVGQGDSILIDHGSEEVLIDGGEKSPGVTDYIKKYIHFFLLNHISGNNPYTLILFLSHSFFILQFNDSFFQFF